jgi:hypothetical protein
MHCARTALRHAAAELGAREPNQVADDPKERHVGRRVDVFDGAVDLELHA